MSIFTKSTSRNATLAAVVIAIASSLAVAGPASASKYDRHTVTKKASFHTLKKHAKHLKHRNVVKVRKIKRHGRVVGFEKTFAKSGDKVIVKRGHHGRVQKTTLKKRSLLRRWKSKISSLIPRHPRSRYNGFKRH